MNLDDIAKKMSKMKLGEQEDLLESLGRTRHIEFETGESERLAEEDPARFFRVGYKLVGDARGKSDEEYARSCIETAKYIYERNPIIFEFYDELMNGIVQEEKQIVR